MYNFTRNFECVVDKRDSHIMGWLVNLPISTHLIKIKVDNHGKAWAADYHTENWILTKHPSPHQDIATLHRLGCLTIVKAELRAQQLLENLLQSGCRFVVTPTEQLDLTVDVYAKCKSFERAYEVQAEMAGKATIWNVKEQLDALTSSPIVFA